MSASSMFRLRLAVASMLLVASTSLASAQPVAAAPEYPAAIVDRPILLYPGITQLDLSEDLPTYLETTVDAMGNTRTTGTGFTDHTQLALSVAHAFGHVQVAATAAKFGYVAVSVDTGTVPAVLTVSATTSAGVIYKDPHYYFDEQSFGVAHKVHFVPGRFALYAGAGVSLIENAATLVDGSVRTGHIVWTSADITGEVQLSRTVGLYASIDLGGPAAQSMTEGSRAVLSSGVELLAAAFRTWDLYGAFFVDDMTRTPLPALSFGFAKRWGM